MGVDHVGVIFSRKCNFNCSYCCNLGSTSAPWGLWNDKFDDLVGFLNSLEGRRMILVSGGEPIIWDKLGDLVESTDHFWYLASNCSLVNPYLKRDVVHDKIKLIIGAYHESQMKLDKFIGVVREMQGLGYPVFVKVMYDGGKSQFKMAEQMIGSGIPFSFVPFLEKQYTDVDIRSVLRYCQSSYYASRFFPVPLGPRREPGLCAAGTNKSFHMNEFSICRCSHRQDDVLGDIANPGFYSEPQWCDKTFCACEWHNFSDLGGFTGENNRWQRFIDTGVWEPAGEEEIMDLFGVTRVKIW